MGIIWETGKEFIFTESFNTSKILILMTSFFCFWSLRLFLIMQANYTKWYDGEPNNAQSGEDCVESTNFNKWNDIDCGDTRKFICEFDENLSFTNMTDLM